MENGQFYLWLPSNSSMDVFPSNTLTEYRVHLPQTIVLTGDWEVAMTEIQYPRSWNNVIDRKNHIYVRDPTGKPDVFIVKAGYYPDVPKLLEGIQKAITSKEARKSIMMTFNDITRRVTITTKNGYGIGFMKELAVSLGFEAKFDMLSGKTTAPNVVDLEGSLRSLFVYSDVIDAQVVGDSRVPLLRIVNIEGKDGETITRTFLDPQYLPVSRKEFQTIEVNIKRDNGEKVPFESGRVLITLHFRRANPLFN